MEATKAITTSALKMGAKASAGSLLTLLTCIFMCVGIFSPGSVHGAISRQANWTSQYAAVAYPAGTVNANYTIAAGSNRLLVVAIASTRTTVGTQTVSNVTYGGMPLTLAAGDSTSATTWNHSYLYYLKETDIQAASSTSLNVTITNGTPGGAQYYTYIYAAVYAGVDQTTPFTSARNFNSTDTTTSNVGPFNPTLTIAANDQAIEIVNLARSSASTTARLMSIWATGWATAGIEPTPYTAVSGPCATLYIRDRTLLTAANDTSQHTAGSASTWDSMTAMSLKAAWPKVATFSVTSPSLTRNIPISAFTADASVPVTGYMITTTATPPTAGAAGWTATAPNTYTVATDGSFTLYPWVKNGTEVSAVYASPVAVVVDTVKPTVSTTIPANSATNVTLNSSITINWSENVNCNTVTTSNITVSGGTLTRTSCSASQAVFSVSGQAYSTPYTVTVGTGVTDANGNAMNAAYPLSYTIQSNPNLTVVGTATASATSASTIVVSMPYTIDGNANNTYTIDYKLTSEPTVWTNWVTADTHAASPYSKTITDLNPVTSYDVRVTWNDIDGVTGTNPQAISGIMTPKWSKVADQTTSPAVATYTAPDGLFRAMVVAVTTEYSTAGTTTTAVSFGGTAMTKAVSDDATSNRVHTALFYLTDSQIPTDAQTLNISATTTNLVNISAYVATFTGVHQTATITNSRNYNRTSSATTAVAFGTALTVNANDQAVYVSNIYNTASTTIPSYTISGNWTSQVNDTGTSGSTAWKTEVSNRAVPGTNTTDNASTSVISLNSLASMSGMSLAYVGACVRNNPTVTITPATRKIIPGASVNYTVSVTNNDTGGCTPTTFTLSKTDTPTGFPTANFSNSVFSSASIGPIAVGATQTVTLTHTATDDAVTGSTEVTSVTAADASHSNVTSTSVTSTVVVSNGKILYSNNSTTPQYGIYTNSTNTFSAGAATLTNAIPTFMVDKASSRRNEHIAGYVTTGGVLYIMRWDGTVWTDEWNVTIPGYAGITGRPFDIDYRGNDTAIVAYSLGTGNAQKFAYKVWDGASWSAPTTVTMAQLNAAGIIVSLKIASKSTGSECTVVAQDSSNYLSAMVYTSPAFGNEKQLSTTVYRNTGAGDVPAFDLAYETTSQDLLVVNTQRTTNTTYINYNTLVGTTWTGPTLSANLGGNLGAVFAVADPNTASNSVLVAATRADTDGTIYALIWNGTAFSTVNTSHVMASTLAVNKMPINGGFVKSGATTAAVVAFNGGTASQLSYFYTTNGGTSWAATANASVTFTNATKSWIDAAMYPQSINTMMFTVADASSDLWAKRLVFTAPSTFDWTNADAGTALTTTLTNITTRNFSFAYDKSKTIVADGVAANSAIVCPASASQKINGFSFETTYSTDTVTGLTVTTTNQAAIASMEIWNEAGTTKYFATVNNSGSDTWVFSGGTPIPVTVTPANYKILVTYKPHATAPLGNTATTATVTTYTSTNTRYGTDTAEGSITLDNAVASNPTWGTNAGGMGTATLDWNSGLASDNTMVVRYTTNTDTTMPTEGSVYLANTAYGVGGTVVYVGSNTAFTDDGNGTLLDGGTYYYRVFEYDGCANYATTAPWSAGVVVSSPYPTMAGTATAVPSSTSSIAVSMPYLGDTNLNNTLKVEYKLTASGSWTTWSGPITHPASPYATTINGLTPGQSYDVKCTYSDANGISGTAVQTITPVVLPVDGTTAGLATASILNPTTIEVDMPYSDDFNGNNTYTVQWKLSSDGSYSPENTITGSHSASPFTATISDLVAETSYDIFVAWNDPDGVTNSPQTILGVVTPYPMTNMSLMHNSTNTTNHLNTNSMKWVASGGWGVNGGKYGAFSCSVCHIPKTSNILRIKTGITVFDTSKGNIPGAANTVNFQSKTGSNTYGNYSAPIGGYSNSQRICETCHSATSYHKYTQTKIRHEEDASLKDCIVCHEHNKGFKPIGACTICHAKPQGARAAVLSQFTTSGRSHHIQGVKVTDQLCYQCHWEANSDGTVNTAYHGGSLTQGAPVRLVRYKNGLRPTVYKDMTSAVLYTANGSRTEVQKINNHCLGCHSASGNSIQPFGDGKTPRQYAWDGKSIDERYSQTGTTSWGKYSDTATTHISPKDTQIKAFSAHGNAGVNKRGWNLAETWPNTSGSVNVLCYDCHNSHGSAASGVTSNYSSATGKYKGAILKATTAGKGGYSVTYKPQAGGSAATKDAYNSGAGLCFDCHNTANAGTKPWGYTGTYGSSQAIIGYWDTPYFTTGTFAPAQRYVFKASNPSHKGGHFGASSAMTTTPSASINGLCTPCHDPHGVSPTLTQALAVPLLKGTWLTSPYLEDTAPSATNENRGGGNQRPIKPVGSTPQYHIDQNTFGQETYPVQGIVAPAGSKSTKWNFTDTTSRVTQTPAQFGGLCLNCHSQTSIAPNAASTAPAWKSLARVHNTVKGWGSTATGNSSNAVHSFTCSKCHTVHNYRLPRLMVTNCLDYDHRGRVAGPATAPSKQQQASNNSPQKGGGGGFPGGGGGVRDVKATGTSGEDAAYLGEWFFGSRTNPTGYKTCHDVATAGGTAGYPANQLWNNKTNW